MRVQNLVMGALVGLLGPACEPTESRRAPPITGEFGVLFGGHVQERAEIPFELDGTRQRQGFRLTLERAAHAPLQIAWELGLPPIGPRVADATGRKVRRRKTRLGHARWRPGEQTFEQLLLFSPGDPLGLWNMRVVVEKRVVIDRAFNVYDAARRESEKRARIERDGGI